MSQSTPVSRTLARRKAQRDRILCAARACFVESGFHAASMATIAETAGMSPGLIYRYFDSKNAIILSIIEQQLTVARRRIRELRSTSSLTDRIIQYFEQPDDAGKDSMSKILYLEISAQAARDPQIAEALRHYDSMVCDELSEWMCRDRSEGGYGLSGATAPMVALLLLSLIEGLMLRFAREPESDYGQLRSELDKVVCCLIEPAA